MLRSVGGSAGLEADGGPLRMVARALEERSRRHYSPVHVAARLAQIDETAAHAQGHRDAVAARAAALQQQLRGRLWLPPTLAARWLDAHAQTLAVLDALLARLHQARTGFAALPVDAQSPDGPPAPLVLEALPA